MAALSSAALHFALRVVVLTVGETDPDVLQGVRALGADTVVTFARPSPGAALAAAAAGLRYIPFLSVQDVDRLGQDPGALAALRSIPGIAGFHYYDDAVLEGYTPADEQGRTYAALKALFPDALILYASRLDPIATDAGYLDAYFRPEYTDFVAPYFYPVGTTVLGNHFETDAWEDRLASLLEALAARMPPGKAVLPVLQAFEQTGFPVGARFAARQLDVYRSVWPAVADVAAFWWGGGLDEPLAGLSERPILARAFRRLFFRLAPLAGPRVVPGRRAAQPSTPGRQTD